jgi:hypothetical protein
MLEKLKAIKTTVLGVITIALSACVLFGWFTPEESAGITEGGINFMDAIIAGIIAVSGVINMFRAE